METDQAGIPASPILEAMEATEPARASKALALVTAEFRARGTNGANFAGLWNSFKRLLARRGYFVASPAELATSLSEIEAVGEGFDLFDLARNLAEYDAARMERRGLAGHCALPELRRFALARKEI